MALIINLDLFVVLAVLLAALVAFVSYLWLQAEKLKSPNCRRFDNIFFTRHADFLNDWGLGGALAMRATYQFRIPFAAHIMLLTDPVNVKHILLDNFWNYEKGWIFRNSYFDLLGDGIFDVDGDMWRFQRKVASHIFKAAELKGFMTETFVRHGQKVLQILEQKAKSGEIFDLQDIFFRYTLDSIGEIAYSTNLGCLEFKEVPFANRFDSAQYLTAHRGLSRLKVLRRLVPSLFRDERQLKADIAVLDKFAYDLISERRETLAKGTGHADRDDILSLFMKYADENGRKLDDHELRDIIMSFIIAGRDTTAIALSWTAYELAKNPAVAEKLYQEASSVAEVRGDASFETVQKNSPYLHAVLKESLRLHPPVPRDAKVALRDDVLPDGTVVKANSVVAWHPYAMGRLPWLWPNPSRFDPERWLAPDAGEVSPFKFIVFNAGPRLCLGMNMALVEAKILLSMIARRFEVKLKEGFEPQYTVSLTMPMLRPGLLVSVHTRPSSD